jgi:psiF repeat
MLMYRYALMVAALFTMVPGPSFAVSEKDKMATCKFGADDQKLEGAARSAFMQKCMANRNDPRGPATGAPAAPAAPPKQQ